MRKIRTTRGGLQKCLNNNFSSTTKNWANSRKKNTKRKEKIITKIPPTRKIQKKKKSIPISPPRIKGGLSNNLIPESEETLKMEIRTTKDKITLNTNKIITPKTKYYPLMSNNLMKKFKISKTKIIYKKLNSRDSSPTCTLTTIKINKLMKIISFNNPWMKTLSNLFPIYKMLLKCLSLLSTSKKLLEKSPTLITLPFPLIMLNKTTEKKKKIYKFF